MQDCAWKNYKDKLWNKICVKDKSNPIPAGRYAKLLGNKIILINK